MHGGVIPRVYKNCTENCTARCNSLRHSVPEDPPRQNGEEMVQKRCSFGANLVERLPGFVCSFWSVLLRFGPFWSG